MVDYWTRRKNFKYYKVIEDFVLKYVPEGGVLMDVGSALSAGCEFLKRFPAKYNKISVENRDSAKSLAGVTHFNRDIYDLSGLDADIVICSQVLEHLENPEAAVKQLIDCVGKVLIISTSYRWPKGREPGHVQDPVTEYDLFHWTGQIPTEQVIVKDSDVRRIIAVYDFRKGREHVIEDYELRVFEEDSESLSTTRYTSGVYGKVETVELKRAVELTPIPIKELKEKLSEELKREEPKLTSPTTPLETIIPIVAVMSEPVKAEPVKAEPVKAEPVKAEPVHVPIVEPIVDSSPSVDTSSSDFSSSFDSFSVD